MLTVAVVPARGGSKGIPRKNLCEINGVPLVLHALKIGVAAKRVGIIVLTTDDAEIADIGDSAGVKVIMRSNELSDDMAPTMPVLQHVLEKLKDKDILPDNLVLLEPTSPFRTAEVVDKCIEKLDVSDVASAFTVTQLERNPNNIFSVLGDKVERYIKEPNDIFTRRQQFTHLKRINGCVYVTRCKHIIEGQLIKPPYRVVEMPAERSINIDTEVDMELAKLLAPRLLNND